MSVHSRLHKPLALHVQDAGPAIATLPMPPRPAAPALESKQMSPREVVDTPSSSRTATPTDSDPPSPTRALQALKPRAPGPGARVALQTLRLMVAHRRNPAEIIPRLVASAQALQASDPGELRRLAAAVTQGMGGAQRLDGRLCHAFIEAACEALRAGELGAAAFQGLAFGLAEGAGAFKLSGENARVVLLALKAQHEAEDPLPARLLLDVFGLVLAAHADQGVRAGVAALVKDGFEETGLGLLFAPGEPLRHAGTLAGRQELDARKRCVELRAALQEAPASPALVERLALDLAQLRLDQPLVGKTAVNVLLAEARTRLADWPKAAQSQFVQACQALPQKKDGKAAPAGPFKAS